MNVGYAVLYTDGELVISKNHMLLQKKIIKDYGEFEDTNVPWKNESSQIKRVQILDQVKSTCMREWFENCINLKTLINFQNLDVSDCTDFSSMFYNCESLQNLNGLSNWNISNGIDFFYMFYDCKSLENIDELQTWNVSSGTDFSYMFALCESLHTVLGSNTLSILRKDMFYKCNSTLKIHWKNHIYIYKDLLQYEEIY